MASPYPRAEPFRAALDVETLGDLALRLGTARLAPGTGRTWERGVPRIAGWAEHDRGGHFPAVAEPRPLAGRLREAFRACRAS